MVVFEDSEIIIAFKPNNILVHHSYATRNMSHETTLIKMLAEHGVASCYPVHRLDRKTSGLVMFAKDKKSIPDLQRSFEHNQIQKTYFGLVRGFIPLEGVIDSPVKGRDAILYKEAETEFKRLNTIELPIPVQPYENSRYSLVELKPNTGRLHQLRIHMNKINHPLIGDPKYGDRFHNRMFEHEMNTTSLFLHARSLQFIQPFSKKEIIVNAPFPEHWQVFAELAKWELP